MRYLLLRKRTDAPVILRLQNSSTSRGRCTRYSHTIKARTKSGTVSHCSSRVTINSLNAAMPQRLAVILPRTAIGPGSVLERPQDQENDVHAIEEGRLGHVVS